LVTPLIVAGFAPLPKSTNPVSALKPVKPILFVQVPLTVIWYGPPGSVLFASKTPLVKVNVPVVPIVIALPNFIVSLPTGAILFIIRLLNAVIEVPAKFWFVVKLLNVTVPVLAVKVPPFTKFPLIFKLPAPEYANVAPVVIVTLPVSVILDVIAVMLAPAPKSNRLAAVIVPPPV